MQHDRIALVVADITTLEVDAVVNAANEALLRGAGVCGAIFRAAGLQLEAACRSVAPCPTGEARITPGFDCKARWIIHAVGPKWSGGRHGESAQLASAYRSALQLAADAGAGSIAFPALSTGIYGYPRAEAAAVALATVQTWCAESPAPERVVLCCFSKDDAAPYEGLLSGRPE